MSFRAVARCSSETAALFGRRWFLYGQSTTYKETVEFVNLDSV